jgi:hypothetical protein
VSGDLADTLLALDRELAGGDGDTYRRRLAPEAVVVVPGAVLDRDACIAAMDASPGWDELDLADARAIALGEDAALLTYTFTGRRGESEPYRAVLSSAWVRRDGEWWMVFHQQTPR